MQGQNPEQQELDLKIPKKKDEIDENGDILVDEHIKIFDPNTNEVFINKRGES